MSYLFNGLTDPYVVYNAEIRLISKYLIAQSAEAVEYTDCFSAEG